MNQSAFLRGIDIFSSLTEEELQLLDPLIKEETFPEGSIIFREDTQGDKIYIVKRGTVEIGKRGGGSQKFARLAQLERGEVFGELSIFDEKPRSAGAVAAGEGETVLLSIRKSELDKLMEQQLAVANKLLKGILCKVSLRLRLADDAIQALLRSLSSSW